MSIGTTIRGLRESRGLSQQQLAEIVGVTDKAISTWENDYKIPRMGAIQKLADFFGVTKSHIIENEKETAPPAVEGRERNALNDELYEKIMSLTADEKKQLIPLLKAAKLSEETLEIMLAILEMT